MRQKLDVEKCESLQPCELPILVFILKWNKVTSFIINLINALSIRLVPRPEYQFYVASFLLLKWIYREKPDKIKSIN